MMMMGGLVMAAVMIPLIAAIMLVVALVSALTGNGTDMLERLLPPDMPSIRALTDPTSARKRETPSTFEPLGARQLEQDRISTPYQRSCQVCGRFVERGWQYCPTCGTRIYWE